MTFITVIIAIFMLISAQNTPEAHDEEDLEKIKKAQKMKKIGAILLLVGCFLKFLLSMDAGYRKNTVADKAVDNYFNTRDQITYEINSISSSFLHVHNKMQYSGDATKRFPATTTKGDLAEKIELSRSIDFVISKNLEQVEQLPQIIAQNPNAGPNSYVSDDLTKNYEPLFSQLKLYYTYQKELNTIRNEIFSQYSTNYDKCVKDKDGYLAFSDPYNINKDHYLRLAFFTQLKCIAMISQNLQKCILSANKFTPFKKFPNDLNSIENIAKLSRLSFKAATEGLDSLTDQEKQTLEEKTVNFLTNSIQASVNK